MTSAPSWISSAVVQRRLEDAPAVDEEAVAAAVVGDDRLAVALHDERMTAGHGGVVEDDVGAWPAADAGDAGRGG